MKLKRAVLGITFGALIGLPFFLAGEIALLVFLLPLSAIFTVLAAYSHKTEPLDLLALLVLLGLGLGFMIVPGSTARLFLVGVFVVLIALLLRQKKRFRFSVRWSIGLYGFALISLFASFVLSPPSAAIGLLLTYAILLPACPLHGASIVSFSRLDGILPNFLALFLPALGFKGVLTILSDLPPVALSTLSVFALIGAVYGGIRALVQTQLRPRLSYAALTFWSVLWWYLAETGTENAPAILYFCALALILQGLFMAGYCLENRYCDLNLDQLGGLAQPMPRFGVCLSLLVAAGMGLPGFGAFTAFFAMATSPDIVLSGSFVVVLLAWLLCSWHLPLFMQGLLLGPPKQGRIYRDLHPSETLSLTLIVAMIILLGIAPYAFIKSDQVLPVQEAAIRLKLR